MTEMSAVKSKWNQALKLMSGPKYELLMNIVTIVNVFSIFARSLQSTANYNTIHIWMIAQIVLNTFFLLEMITDWIVAGFKNAYIYHFRTSIETLCQILSVPSLIYFFSGNMNPDVNNASFDYQQYNRIVKIFEVIVFVRMVKLLTLLYEVKTMRIIVETCKNMVSPLSNLLAVMLTILYVFSEIGMAIFGGDIRKTSPGIIHDSSIPDNYYLINYNDLISSMVTLFILMVVNNWYVIVQMCVDIKGGDVYYRYYFMIFYYFGVIIGLNVIIAFAIDMYSAVERLD